MGALRSHDINYMVAYPLIFGELTSQSYNDDAARDPRIDELRAKITCVEDQRFSTEYHEPEKRSISNALLVELKDGTVLEEVEIEYPVGHKRRREEGTPLLLQKFQNHIKPHFSPFYQEKLVRSALANCRPNLRRKHHRILTAVNDAESLNALPVHKFTDLCVKP